MEIQLQELIEQIKKDGVAAAEAEAKAIIESAKAEADRIIADAKAQSDRMLANAKNENEKMTRSSEDAIRQAGRNLLISFRESVAKELNAIVGEGIRDVYSSEAIKDLIVKVVENWASKPDTEDLSLILSSEDIDKLESDLLSALKGRMKKGITLTSSSSFNSGFRIASDKDSIYYDYSEEAVVDMLSAYLSPKITKLLKEAE